MTTKAQQAGEEIEHRCTCGRLTEKCQRLSDGAIFYLCFICGEYEWED